MMTALLDSETAPLHRLALHRLQLEKSDPHISFDTMGDEGLLYCLTGSARVQVHHTTALGVYGRRTTLARPLQARLPALDVLRFPTRMQCHVDVTLEGYACDMLYVTRRPHATEEAVSVTPYSHRGDAHVHAVGTGCYARTVTEVPTPLGYTIHCGETYSDGQVGVWSSWPSHCAPDEMSRYAEHEEIFFAVTPGYFVMKRDGQYCTGKHATGVQVITNGQALVTPLGSHELAVSPGTFGWYGWFYISFLQKAYNKYATDVKVYTK